ncbi:predicted protein [Histoplasma capsulatum H143]|uniref:Uncharacterized protein n=1 Tax=Ajellomyces capsulatus (strain H143) TaxID=544712 RepID=C6HPQ5_AJECH|nr:predicted protein [Histoplasma capsulatum H143]
MKNGKGDITITNYKTIYTFGPACTTSTLAWTAFDVDVIASPSAPSALFASEAISPEEEDSPADVSVPVTTLLRPTMTRSPVFSFEFPTSAFAASRTAVTIVAGAVVRSWKTTRELSASGMESRRVLKKELSVSLS